MPVPRISVLMTVYNGRRYLDEAVQSVLGQTMADFEFIIVDDGSTDETRPMLEAYAAQDSRLVLLYNEANMGLTRSLNKALGRAQGEYVARQDADDISRPERFDQQVAFLDSHPEVGVLSTVVELIDENGQTRQPRYFEGLETNEALQQQLLDDFCVAHGSVMARRTCYQAVGGYDPAMEPAEDHDMWLRLGEITQLASLPDPLYRYRLHGTSVSKTRRNQQVLRLAQVIENALRRRSQDLTPAARAYLRAAIVAGDSADLPGAKERLAHALQLRSTLLDSDEPLAGLLLDYSTPLPVEEGLALYRTLFREVLPHTGRLNRLHRRLISRLHMRQVFAGEEVGVHLRPAIQHDPSWLLNRGVMAILVRSLLGR